MAEITISWMVKPVTGDSGLIHRGLRRSVAVLCREGSPATPLAHHETATSSAPDSPNACRDRAAGRKIAPLHKKSAGGDPCKAKPRSIRFCVEMRGQGGSRRGRDGGDRQRGDLSRRVRQARPVGKDDAMTADSVFWIASMTKAITTRRRHAAGRTGQALAGRADRQALARSRHPAGAGRL